MAMRYSELAARVVVLQGEAAGRACWRARIASKAWWGMATNGASGGREPQAFVARVQPHDEWY